MNPDDLRQAWQAQAPHIRLTIDAEILLREVQRNHQTFVRTIFWRDVREVGTAAVLIPVWVYLGLKLSLPWTWYLTVPAMVWITAFIALDRFRHPREPARSSAAIREYVRGSLKQLEHQIWLLRSITWWYLLPLALPVWAFFAQLGWEVRASGWLAVLITVGLSGIAAVSFAVVYRINQQAVQNRLIPRCLELEALLRSLGEDAPEAK